MLFHLFLKLVVDLLFSVQSNTSAVVEDSLANLARKHATVRFVKLNHVEAEMAAPTILGYKGGDLFATVADIFNQLPSGRDCSASSLETLLQAYVTHFLDSFTRW